MIKNIEREQNFFWEIIKRAVQDALVGTAHPIYGGTSLDKKEVERARKWIFSESQKEFSFRWYISILDQNEDFIFKKIKNYVNHFIKSNNEK